MPALLSSTVTVMMLSTLCLAYGGAPLDYPLPVRDPDILFQYDDGTACWLSWDGLYRGVWFHQDDFMPGGQGGAVLMELWFYHHASYPWDVSSFYAEFYNGDEDGPVTQIDQTSVMAVHFAPCYACYDPFLPTESDFWGIVNTEISSGGWPSLLSDNSSNWTGFDHSFYSEDFVTWVPWAPGYAGLEPLTWGSIKALYDDHRALSTPGSCDYFIRIEVVYGASSCGSASDR